VPVTPLSTVDASEISIFIRPFVPNCDAMHVEVFDVRIAAQKPEQLVDNRFDVKLFRGEQRKSWTTWPQIIARLSAKDRQGAGARAIAARLTLFQDKPEKIVVLPHAKSYRGRGFRKMFLARVFAGQTGSNVTLVNVAPVRFRAAPCARSTFAIVVASGCNWIHELVDVSGDFSRLRFVFSQFCANFFGVRERVCFRLLRLSERV